MAANDAVASGLRVRGRAPGRHRSATLAAAAGLLAFLVGGSIVASLALPDPNAQELSDALAPPGAAGHLLGTDPLGRDVLAWIASGIRISLVVSITVVALSAVVGITVGLLAGYFGGVLDAGLMRLADLQLAVPPLLLFISASALVRPGLFNLIVLISVVSWVPYARLVRTTVVSERERAYIAAARLSGASHRRVLFTHLLRAVATLGLVIASLQAGYVLLWEASLSFLGLGIQPPLTSLGFIISQGRTVLQEAWWVVVCPGVVIALLVVAFNLLGDGLRDVFHADVDVFGR